MQFPEGWLARELRNIQRAACARQPIGAKVA